MKKAEKEHLARVAALGCIICRRPAEIHHIRTGQGRRRAGPYETIPLCPEHHRHGNHGVAFHAGPRTWQENFGTEHELLEQVQTEIGRDQ